LYGGMAKDVFVLGGYTQEGRLQGAGPREPLRLEEHFEQRANLAPLCRRFEIVIVIFEKYVLPLICICNADSPGCEKIKLKLY